MRRIANFSAKRGKTPARRVRYARLRRARTNEAWADALHDLEGYEHPDRARLHVNDLIQESVALVSGEVRRNRVALRTELAADLPPVLGDRVQLQQVLLNLIINGIEAMSTVTGRPRELLVRTREGQPGVVTVSVRDNGVGLGHQDADRLFDAFYTTKAGGMGMGLSVSRSIVEAHGGRLWAESDGRPGATFRFELPADGGAAP